MQPAEIRAQVDRVLASSWFKRSGRMCRFLKFVVEHALAGTGDQIKEYLIGVEVFDRRDYDPRVDPIVRVEARRLRSKLKAYYATTGKRDGVIAEFPKGAYIPTFRLRAAPRPTRRREPASSVAVLPFTNLTPRAGDEYFSDGLAEELNLLLTRVENLRVVAWHSAAQFRGRQEDLRAIRERLNVSFVLKGAVRRTAAQVRVTVQLIDTGSGAVLWSEAYNRALSGVFAIQAEIARAIVNALRSRLGTASPPLVKPIPNLECYNLCLQGRFHANKRTREGILKSAACYAAAVQKDAQCGAAYAGLADSYSLLSDYSLMAPQDAVPQAESAARKALELDPQSADALASLAFIRSIFDWRWSEAEGLYRQAIALNPSNSKARHWFATDHLAMLGRFDEALEQIQIARMLDPLSLIIHEGHAYIHILRRDFETALATSRQIAEFDPRFYKAYATMGRAFSLSGRYEEALAVWEKARELGGNTPSSIAAIGQTRALAGDRKGARRALRELKSKAASAFVPCTCFAILYLGLGEIGQCLDWLERAADRHEAQIGTVNVHPLYDPLRGEPRFQKILARAGFLP